MEIFKLYITYGIGISFLDYDLLQTLKYVLKISHIT